MPIGKNALKRVSNNGYSNVSVSAPDMEHSEIIEAVEPKKENKAEPKKVTAPQGKAKKSTEPKAEPKKVTAPQGKAKKSTEPKAEPKKKSTTKAKKPEEKRLDTAEHPDGFLRFVLGDELPEYLL